MSQHQHQHHKTINLYHPGQIQAFENAKNAIDDDASDGDVVRALAAAYTGWDCPDTE